MAEDQANTLAALRFMRIRVGTWKLLAKVLRFEASTMRNVNQGRQPRLDQHGLSSIAVSRRSVR